MISFRRSLEFFLHQQPRTCRGVTITGVLGESNRLVDSERGKLIQCARETITAALSATAAEDGQQKPQQFDLCVGTSHSGTAATVALSQMAKELGATSVMVTPHKDGASEDDIMELFQRVANVCGPNVDIVLQDHPSSTGVVMSCELLYRIVTTIPTVRCIKLESMPTIHRLAILRNKYPDIVQHCTILTGLGALYSGYDLESGMTSGFMTGFAFPEIVYAMNQYAQQQQSANYDKAQELYRKFLPLIVLEQTPVYGLAIRKEIYKIRGLIDCAHVRHPGKNLTPTLRNALRLELERSFPKGIDLTQPVPEEILEV